MVFQEGALFDSMTVRDNVAYRLIEEHASAEEINQASAGSAAICGAGAHDRQIPLHSFRAECVAGWRSPARIISKPDLLLYDSPTGGLDPITSTTIIELVVKQRDVSHTQFPAGDAPAAGRVHDGDAQLRCGAEQDAAIAGWAAGSTDELS